MSPHYPQVEAPLVRLAVGRLGGHPLFGPERPVHLLAEREEAGPVARDPRRGFALAPNAHDSPGRPDVQVGDLVLGAFAHPAPLARWFIDVRRAA